jgi:hypothetical protein
MLNFYVVHTALYASKSSINFLAQKLLIKMMGEMDTRKLDQACRNKAWHVKGNCCLQQFASDTTNSVAVDVVKKSLQCGCICYIKSIMLYIWHLLKYFVSFFYFSNNFFVGVPHLVTYIFLIFQTEPELDAGINPGMAFTPFPSSILEEMRF